VGEVQYWVRTIRANSERPLAFFPNRSLQLCEDECIAVSLVAAAQTGDCDAGCCAAGMLIGTEEALRVNEVWQASSHIATALRCSGQVMHACPRTVMRMLGNAAGSASPAPSYTALN
jgi:hypothetical protein